MTDNGFNKMITDCLKEVSQLERSSTTIQAAGIYQEAERLYAEHPEAEELIRSALVGIRGNVQMLLKNQEAAGYWLALKQSIDPVRSKLNDILP